MAGPVDKWGIPFLYATKQTAGVSGSGSGFFWQQENDIRNDSHVWSLDSISNVNTTTGEFQINYGSSDSWVIGKDPSFENTNSIGGCDMNFAQSVERGYAWKADQPRDVEIKMLIKVVDGNNEGFSIGSSTGKHSSDGCCSGFNYMFNIFLSDNPVKFRFRKEMWHVNYDNDPKTGEWNDTTNANFQLESINRFVGFAFCRYNLKDFISAGKDGVACEAWINPNPEANITDWRMMKRTIDTGGWGDGGDQCNGDNSQVGTWSNGQFRIKSDSGVVIKFKNCSLREIDPTLSFEDTGGGGGGGEEPPPPEEVPDDPTIVQGSFQLQWDVNQTRSNPCAGTQGGGDEGGTARFYEVDGDNTTELSNVSLFQNRTRVVEIITNSSSAGSGKILKQLDVPMMKVGSPADDHKIVAKIWSSTGSVKYKSLTEILPSTLSTSSTVQEFNFETNTLPLVTGDRIGVQWNGGTDSNYVVVFYDGSDPIPNMHYSNFEGTSDWDTKMGRDFSCTMWQ